MNVNGLYSKNHERELSTMTPSQLPYVPQVEREYLESLTEEQIIQLLIATTRNIVRIAEQLVNVRQEMIDANVTQPKRQRKS